MHTHRWAALFFVMSGTVLAAGSRVPTPSSSAAPAAGEPDVDGASHRLGRLALSVTNTGTFGGAEYPQGSFKYYFTTGNLVIGAILGQDTLVTFDFTPAAEPNGKIIETSSMDPALPWYDSLAAHQDCLATYYDTCSADCGDHIPLNVEVTERSRSWVYEYAQDLVLFDYTVTNLGDRRLNRVYVGIYGDGDVRSAAPGMDPAGSTDDVVGLLETYPAWYLETGCPPDTDVVNIVWTADNDGNMLTRTRCHPMWWFRAQSPSGIRR